MCVVNNSFSFLIHDTFGHNCIFAHVRQRLSPAAQNPSVRYRCTVRFPCRRRIMRKAMPKRRHQLNDAAKIVPLCNNTSPAFVIGAIGVSMLNSKPLGLLIYISQLIASLILLIPIKTENRSSCRITENRTMTEIFFSAIEKSIAGILKVCALICIFTVAVSLLDIYIDGTLLAFVSAVIEIGSGSSYSTAIFNYSPFISVALCGFACGWSGICVHMQMLSALKAVKGRYSSIIISKALQGGICALLSIIGYYLFFT